MTRSRKKPYITDNGQSAPAKRRANKRVRRTAKLTPGENQPASGKAYRKEFQSWNIRDYSFYAPDMKKAWRK